jgi:hypothetical protein
MLLSIDKARKNLPNFWLGMGIFNTMALVLFLVPLFENKIPAYPLLCAMAVVACVGFVVGAYVTFRSRCGSTAALLLFLYMLLTMEIMFAGGVAALAVSIAGRVDLRWLAFFTNAFCMVVTLLDGIYHEAKAIGWRRTSTSDRWKKGIEKYIDYSTYQISPSLTYSATENASAIKSPFWIVAVGSANIPLFFEYFAGGRSNAIFFAVLCLTGVFIYVNLKYWGRDLLRLLLLRKLEKSLGRRFVNADLEQIQQLRRGFFMARWLMKDFVQVQVPESKVR